MIFFTCQNGHRLHSQTLQPGQWIRCPRCGIVTQIPEQSTTTISTPTNMETSDTEAAKVSSTSTISATLSTESDSVSSGTSSSESQRLPDASQTVPWVEAEVTDGTSSSTEESTDAAFSTPPISQTETPLDAASNTPCEPEWEFLCPNGHLLHSTQAFQGRLGECPECHSRFRIPTLVPSTNPTDTTDASNASTSSNATKMTGNGMGNGTGNGMGNALGGHRNGNSGSLGNAGNLGNSGTGNLSGINVERFGESFTRLWELHRRLPILFELEQGRRVVISEFHADLSDDVLGVFTGYVQSSSAQTSESASDTSNHSTPEKPETLAIPWYSIVLMRFASELETF